MSAGPARILDGILDGCLEALGRIGARLAALCAADVETASRLLAALREAASDGGDPGAASPKDPGSGGPPVLASDACPACGSEEVGTVESVPGVALGRISGGRMEWTGTTEIDWNGSETLLRDEGVPLACPACGERWVHPSVALDGA